MKTKSKVALLLLSAVLLVTGSIMGTLAYLTSQDTVTNTFTIGKVAIDLDEAKTNEYGEGLNSSDVVATDPNNIVRTDTGNEYKLIPARTYLKDPTVTVKADSEASYIRLLITITDLQDLNKLYGKQFSEGGTENMLKEFLTWDETGDGTSEIGFNSTNWNYVSWTVNNDNTVTLEFRYIGTYETVTSNADEELPLLFDGFIVPSTWDNAELETIADFNMVIEAQAIQADSFSNAPDAWAAFDTQFTTTN